MRYLSIKFSSIKFEFWKVLIGFSCHCGQCSTWLYCTCRCSYCDLKWLRMILGFGHFVSLWHACRWNGLFWFWFPKKVMVCFTSWTSNGLQLKDLPAKGESCQPASQLATGLPFSIFPVSCVKQIGQSCAVGSENVSGKIAGWWPGLFCFRQPFE